MNAVATRTHEYSDSLWVSAQPAKAWKALRIFGSFSKLRWLDLSVFRCHRADPNYRRAAPELRAWLSALPAIRVKAYEKRRPRSHRRPYGSTGVPSLSAECGGAGGRACPAA